MGDNNVIGIKDLFGFGFPALFTFGTSYLIHINKWFLSFIGLLVMFIIWIFGTDEMWAGMATAIFISGLIELILFSNNIFGWLFIILAVIIFVVPLVVRAFR